MSFIGRGILTGQYQHISSRRVETMTLAVGADGEGDMHFSRAFPSGVRLPVLFVYGLSAEPLRRVGFASRRSLPGQRNDGRLKSATLGLEKQRVNTLATISNDTLTRR